MGVILKVGDEVLSRIIICFTDLCGITTVINNLTCTRAVGAGTTFSPREVCLKGRLKSSNNHDKFLVSIFQSLLAECLRSLSVHFY